MPSFTPTTPLFFCTDLETIGTDVTHGALASIGCVALHAKAGKMQKIATFSANLSFPEGLENKPENQGTKDFWDKNPEAFRALFSKPKPMAPINAMPAFAKWISGLSKIFNARPYLVSDNVVFEGMWLWHYFQLYNNRENPFRHSRHINIYDMESGFTGNPRGTTAGLDYPKPEKLPHIAIEDAHINAEMFIFLTEKCWPEWLKTI